ncbi:hypothetical protein [Nocardia sp. NPDC056100]|uniref:hypothetical protein n=1 Tax=Nocardia sp. NPDC056100 TaxID=3345712 RepID=UPI0035D6F630
MRSLWFIPHGITFIGPDRRTPYWGGFSSTLNPITGRQAAAVSARGQRRAREAVSLLEGAGFVSKLDGSESWRRTDFVGEGFNRFDKGFNGRTHWITARFDGPPVEFDELVRLFAAMPDAVVRDTHDRTTARGRTLVVRLAARWGHSGVITLLQKTSEQRITAGLEIVSGPYFYRWAKRDPGWRIVVRGRDSNLAENTAREVRRLGYKSREWPVHVALTGGIARSEALTRVRLYLRGAGVDLRRARLRAHRADNGWQIAITGDSALHALARLDIDAAGRIGLPGE